MEIEEGGLFSRVMESEIRSEKHFLRLARVVTPTTEVRAKTFGEFFPPLFRLSSLLLPPPRSSPTNAATLFR